MKFLLICLLFSFQLLANDQEVTECVGDTCNEQALEFDQTTANVSDEEVENSYDTTEDTLNSINREIAGTIEEE